MGGNSDSSRRLSLSKDLKEARDSIVWLAGRRVPQAEGVARTKVLRGVVRGVPGVE